MHSTPAKTLLGFALTAALAFPGAAAAATKTYGGTTDSGGKIAIDAVVKQGHAVRIAEARADNLKADCEESGTARVYVTVPGPIDVADSGKFKFTYTKPGTELKTTLRGKFRGAKDKKVSGTFVYADHFPASDTQPAEDCVTKELGYSAKRGGPDVELPSSRIAP